MATVQRKYKDALIWQALREAGLSVDDVQVRDVHAIIDDERPDQQNAVFRVSFEWDRLELDHHLAGSTFEPVFLRQHSLCRGVHGRTRLQ